MSLLWLKDEVDSQVNMILRKFRVISTPRTQKGGYVLEYIKEKNEISLTNFCTQNGVENVKGIFQFKEKMV